MRTTPGAMAPRRNRVTGAEPGPTVERLPAIAGSPAWDGPMTTDR